MKKIILFSTLSYLLLAFPSYAQEKSVKSLQTGLGLTHSSLQDQVFSPLVFRGTGFSFDVNFLDEKSSRKHVLRMNLFSQQLSPSQNPRSVTTVQNTVISVDYSFIRNLKNSGNWKYYLGGGLQNVLASRNIVFIFEDEIAFDLFSSLNVVGRVERTFNQKHRVTFTLSYPL